MAHLASLELPRKILHCIRLGRTMYVRMITHLLEASANQMDTTVETVGYIGRAASHNNAEAIGPFVIQNLLLLVAPALFAATIYMVLGRIIRLLHAEHHSPIRVTRLTKYFVWGDVICFWAQGQGGGLQAVGKPLFTTLGRWIVVGGLILQVLIFCLFIVVAWTFNTRINRCPTIQSSNPSIPWKKHMRALYICSALILLRNLVRLIEYLEGYDGWVITHEVMLYIFDSLPMLMVFLALAIWHPCELLNNTDISNDSPEATDLEASSAIGSPSLTEQHIQELGKR
jgi:hypothetical protein